MQIPVKNMEPGAAKDREKLLCIETRGMHGIGVMLARNPTLTELNLSNCGSLDRLETNPKYNLNVA